MKRIGWVLLAAALAAAGCRGGSEGEAGPMGQGASFYVYKGDKKVLWIKNEPGTLASQAPPPPPGTPMTRHPFLTGSSLDIREESRLGELLDKAKSFEEYAGLLKKDGYRLEPAGPTP